MNPKTILSDLEDLAARMGWKVRYERMGDDEIDTRSGRCRVGKNNFILIDYRLDLTRRLAALCRELGEMDLTAVYVKPYLRALLEKSISEDHSPPINTPHRNE